MEKAPSLPRINRRKISDRVYEILREKVISKEFAPGQRLSLDIIEKQLNISRTPLREALARLEMEGLVAIIPQSGTYVTNPDPKDITESFEVRRMLELGAIELAIPQASDDDLKKLRALVQELGELAVAEEPDVIYTQYLALDNKFHRELVALTGNQRLCQAHIRENVHAQMARIRYRSYGGELGLAQEEHMRIMALLEAKDVEATKAEMDAHLKRALHSLLADMGVRSEEESPTT